MFALASILSLVALIISVPIFLVFGLGSSIAAIELPKPNTKKIGTEIIRATKDIIDANVNI